MSEILEHDEVRRWAEQLDMRPFAAVDGGGNIRTVSLGVPGHLDTSVYGSETKPEEISWDVFFREFDESAMAFDTELCEVVRRSDAAA